MVECIGLLQAGLQLQHSRCNFRMLCLTAPADASLLGF